MRLSEGKEKRESGSEEAGFQEGGGWRFSEGKILKASIVAGD